MENKFETNTIVFYETGLRWLTLEKNRFSGDDSAELHDGRFVTSGGPYILKQCRHVTQFIFTVAQALRGYTHEMSESRVLNPDTGRKFNQMVLDFIDTYSEWNDESRKVWEELYGYKDRLINLKEEYKKKELSI